MSDTTAPVRLSAALLERLRDRLELARRHDQTSMALIDEATAMLGLDPDQADIAADVLVEWALNSDGLADGEPDALMALACLGVSTD